MTRTGSVPSCAKQVFAGVAQLTLTAVFVFALAHYSFAQGQEPKKPVAPPTLPAPGGGSVATIPGTAGHELTATDVEAFLDGMMPAQLERENIAGAVIAVVKDGKVLFVKGYGYSDVAKHTPVTGDATLFRPGSISKLFTWTSVMQLVEQRKLDLDKDVNDYIDFKIPPAYDKPITLRDIMTHTPGFEETARDLFVADAQHLTPLDVYLKGHLPNRIFPPFIIPAYSNYATSMAGYIVQRVSGKPFEQYVAENIFQPLEMKRTTFVQPLPAELAPLMSQGYQKASDEKAKPFEVVEAFPAGSVSTTGRDMCNFMIAHLQDGRFGDKQILRGETAKQMHSRTFGTDDRLNGMALGFYEDSRNGQRIIAHGGDTEFFHSDLHLILAANVGIFVSYNSAGRGEVSGRSILFEKFMDRYFPYTPPAPGKVDPKADNAQIAGFYKVSRRFESSFLKLLTFAGEGKVVPNADGTICLGPLKGPNGELLKWEEVQPFLYRRVNGQDLVGFKKDGNGNWQFQVEIPVFIFQKVGFFENKHLNYAVLIFGLGVVLLTVLLWPVGALIRRRYQRPLALEPAERRRRLQVRLVCVLFTILFVGWVTVLSMANDINGINSLPKWVIIFGILGLICSLGTILVVLNAFRSWGTSGRWIWAKLHDVALAIACVGLVWFLFYWKLMNFNTHF